MQNLINQFMATGFGDNSAQRLLVAVTLFIALELFFLAILPFFLKRFGTHVPADQRHPSRIIFDFLSRVPFLVWAILSLAIAASILILPPRAEMVTRAFVLILSVTLAILLIRRLLEYFIGKLMHGKDGGALPAILDDFLAIVLWILGVLLVLSNIGVNVTSLVAGLGIGGVAIALASQRILGDIFSSFSIYFDKPFREGDYIVTGEHSGFVRKIGLKTTRIQAVAGEEIIIPNQELTQARVRNYRRMHERHVEFDLTLAPDTPAEKLRKIPMIVRSIIEPMGLLTFDRVTFMKMNKMGVTFSVVYQVKNSDHISHVNALQDINFKIYEELQKEGILLGQLVP